VRPHWLLGLAVAPLVIGASPEGSMMVAGLARAGTGAPSHPVISGRPSTDKNVQSARAMIASMIGDWSGVMRAEVPPNTEDIPWRVSCAPIARNAGVLCHSGGTASIGPIEQSCLLAIAPGDDEVHLMCVSSMGEVHDHHGRYDDGRIRFVPLRARIAGKMTEEIVEYQIAPNGTMRTLSVVREKAHPEMRFMLHATRLSRSGEIGKPRAH
jgi:hypothetical protein